MRIEATIPDPRAEALQQLADDLRITKSQVIDEALAIFQKIVVEARKGNAAAIVERGTKSTVVELSTPTLAQLEWTAHREAFALSLDEAAKVHAVAETSPNEPSPGLKAAFAKYKASK